MKLVHVLGTLEAGGAERFVVSLVCELRRRGWDVGLWALGAQTDDAGQRMASDLAEARVPVLVGPTAAVRLRSVLWYVGRMRRLRPELVHLHTPNTETIQMFVPPPWRPWRGLVRTVHNTFLEITDMHVFAVRATHVACSIFCSEASREWNRDWVRGPSQVIPYGVRGDLPLRTGSSARDAKQRLGLEADRVHFLHMGRMEGDDLARCQKGQDVLLNAWRASGAGEANGILHLLGDGNLRSRLAALALGDASVRFHGVRGDAPDWLVAADCFVLPSRFEGLPVAGLEAVSAGLPACSRASGPSRSYSLRSGSGATSTTSPGWRTTWASSCARDPSRASRPSSPHANASASRAPSTATRRCTAGSGSHPT